MGRATRNNGAAVARGRWAEERAARHLATCGLSVLARNWRDPQRLVRGELDIVAGRAGLVVFCEVKARRSTAHGGAAAAVDDVKQARLRGLAEAWLLARQATTDETFDVRFDVIAIDGVRLTHIEAAF